MISRAIVFDSAMSVPTSRPAHTSAHWAERGPPRVDRVEPRPTLHAFQQVVEEDRMRLPGVRSPEQDAVRLLNLAIRARPAAHAEYRRQTGDARGVSRTVAAVDVVRADHHARELLRRVVHLVRALRAAEQAERLRAVRSTTAGNPAAARSSASSHVAGRSSPPRASRTIGCVRRSCLRIDRRKRSTAGGGPEGRLYRRRTGRRFRR